VKKAPQLKITFPVADKKMEENERKWTVVKWEQSVNIVNNKQHKQTETYTLCRLCKFLFSFSPLYTVWLSAGY